MYFKILTNKKVMDLEKCPKYNKDSLIKTPPNYLEIAKHQFLNLKEEFLDMDRKAIGSEDDTNYEVDKFKFKIKVDGYWEDSTWFNYEVLNEQNEIIEKGDYCF
jgi:hypothetical protein